MAISVVKGVHIDLTDDAVLDYSQDVDTAVMVGKFGAATAGVEGIAFAGSCGTAIVTGSGVAIVGEYIYPFPKYGRAGPSPPASPSAAAPPRSATSPQNTAATPRETLPARR